jgi:transaldolase
MDNKRTFNISNSCQLNRDTTENPVNTKIIEELTLKFEDFRRAYDENGLSLEEFDTYGATRRTLRFFISGYHNLVKDIHDLMISDPDIRAAK